MKTRIATLLALIMPILGMSQAYTDYIGAGHNAGMTVTSSDNRAGMEADKTLDGSGMDSKYFTASRFLSQASMGFDDAHVQELLDSDLDYGAWIDTQMAMDSESVNNLLDSIWEIVLDWRVNVVGENPEEIFGPYKPHFDYAYTHRIMTAEDLLRQKVVNALSQILVISVNSDIRDWPDGMGGWYDMLQEHAFGNYRDLLYDVTVSTQMAYYLSHFNNAKADPVANTSPDENYAREIMQLFTIGLYELNMDGSRLLDQNGDPIPTYDQDDIQQFAQVFTGLGIDVLRNPDSWPYEPFFGLDLWAAKKDEPLRMYEDYHETAEKTLLNGLVLPANQPGLTDINMAIDNLFNHSSTPPFLSNLLIKRLVKSNPSPQYIERVANVFVNNGSGVRGDLGAVIKAILLDEEARSGTEMFAFDAGRVKEPLQKWTSTMRMLPLDSPSGWFWHQGFGNADQTGQWMLASPTVFNFYLPDHQPIGDIADEGLTSPELKLHNTSTAINAINNIFVWNFWGNTPLSHWEWWRPDPNSNNWDPIHPEVEMQHDLFLSLSDHPELLVNTLDKMFTYGQLSDQTRTSIVNTLKDTYWTWNEDWRWERVQAAFYYILISPDYAAIK